MFRAHCRKLLLVFICLLPQLLIAGRAHCNVRRAAHVQCDQAHGQEGQQTRNDHYYRREISDALDHTLNIRQALLLHLDRELQHFPLVPRRRLLRDELLLQTHELIAQAPGLLQQRHLSLFCPSDIRCTGPKQERGTA